jgi:dienelactone hydrolase
MSDTIGCMILALFRFAACFAFSAPTIAALAADEPPANAVDAPAAITPTDYLMLPAVGQYGRLMLQRDAVEAQLVTGTWKAPAAGDAVKTPDGKSGQWLAVKASDDGTLDTQKLRGGYAFTAFDSPVERVMLLEASGHAMVYVNGEPHTGDPYDVSWLRLPVLIKKGQNTLLFHLSGERLKAILVAQPEKPVSFSEKDITVPTLERGQKKPDWVWGAAPIVNATPDWIDGAKIECSPKGAESRSTPVAPMPPLSSRKVPFQIPVGGGDVRGEPRFTVRLVAANAAKDAPKDAHKSLAEFEMTLKLVGPPDIRVRTFRSRMDGSVQSYTIIPTAESTGENNGKLPTKSELPGLIVALHDAGMSSDEYIAQYGAKPWAHILAPQGRRPYGFDWEAWSRKDVEEAMRDAANYYKYDPRRAYLTGHSMGGHGAWHLGVTYPDQFAAIGPSSAWISYWSYGGGMPSMETPSDIDAILLRGYSASDTIKLLTNLSNTGVYVLHGAGDQTVPIAQARFMRTRLAAFHPNFVYFEQPGADHWWGNECCDSPRMMEFFQGQSTPNAADQTFIDFTTANPAVSSRCNWVSIEAQQEQLSPSHVAIRQNTAARTFVGNTSNVSRLAIDVAHLSPGLVDMTLDGQSLNWLNWPGDAHELWFERQGEQWKSIEAPAPQLKGPARYGTFNSVFDNNALLVYGTAGNAEENAWAAAKARYDAETFYYRGGGALEVLPDSRFDMNRDADRNVILYGNADTNSAWQLLLSTSPVEVRRGQVRVGTRTETAGDLAVLTVRPRPGSDRASVGVVSGTGLAGMRLTNRLRWFVSGIVYPDLMILEPKILTDGTAGIRACGYFGLDWSTETGEINWRGTAL